MVSVGHLPCLSFKHHHLVLCLASVAKTTTLAGARRFCLSETEGKSSASSLGRTSGKGGSFFQRGCVTVEVSTGEKKRKNSKIAGQALMVNKTKTGQATSLKKHQTD